MFYRAEILARKGKLAAPWIAAHFDRRLSKSDIMQVNIDDTVDTIKRKEVPELALRTSSHILLGLSRIFLRKTKILYDECAILAFDTGKKGLHINTNTTKYVDFKKVTHEVRIADFIQCAYNSMPRTSIDIEEARMSYESLSMFDRSFSLNDLTLIDAVTFISGAVDLSDGVITQQGSCGFSRNTEEISNRIIEKSDIHSDNVCELEDKMSENTNTMIREIDVTTSIIKQKRSLKSLDNNPIKKVKIDKNISFQDGKMKIVEYIERIYKENKLTNIGREIEEALRLIECGTQENREISINDSIEIPRHGSISHIEGIHQSILNGISANGDASYISNIHYDPVNALSTISDQEHSLIENSEGFKDKTQVNQSQIQKNQKDYDFEKSKTKQDKAMLFISLLQSITQGYIYAEQNTPYSAIKTTPILIK